MTPEELDALRVEARAEAAAAPRLTAEQKARLRALLKVKP